MERNSHISSLGINNKKTAFTEAGISNQVSVKNYEKPHESGRNTERISVFDQLNRIDFNKITKKNINQDTCNVCYDKQANAVLMECGHGGICYQCANKLLIKTNKCPLCRLGATLILEVDIKNSYGSFVKVLDSNIVKTK